MIFDRRLRGAGMMEEVRTSETSVGNHFTQQYIPEDNSELPNIIQLRNLYLEATVYKVSYKLFNKVTVQLSPTYRFKFSSPVTTLIWYR
jgi:hypothetical protein